MKHNLFSSPSFAVVAVVLGLSLSGCGSSEEPRHQGPPPQEIGGIPGAHPTVRGGGPRPIHQGDEIVVNPGPESRDRDHRVGRPRNPSGRPDASPATEVPTYSQKVLAADLKNLQAVEASLEGVGLKVILKTENNQIKSLNWDYAFMDAYKGDMIKDAVPALENFSNVGHAFLRKYDREFIVNGSTSTSERLADSTIRVLTAKLMLAETSLESLKPKKN